MLYEENISRFPLESSRVEDEISCVKPEMQSLFTSLMRNYMQWNEKIQLNVSKCLDIHVGGTFSTFLIFMINARAENREMAAAESKYKI